MATRILILYHSSIFEKRPGADQYIYTTAKILSEANIVYVMTWGEGESKTVSEGNLTIVHFGNGRKKHNLVKRGKRLGFLIDTLAYLGFHYMIFLQRKKGPSVSNVLDIIKEGFDVAIRVSYNNNKIPKWLKKRQSTPVVELAIVGGLPHYLSNIDDWTRYIGLFSPISMKPFKFLYRVMRRIVFKFYVSSLASRNVIVISQVDRKMLENVPRLKVQYIPPLLDFNTEVAKVSDNRIALFFSGDSLAAQIACRFILAAARKVKDVQFFITGFAPDFISTIDIPDNLKFTGFLEKDKFEDLFERSSIIILPLISGSGLQTKMAEALSKAKPIITTSVIADEFPGLENGEHVLVEDDPAQFVEKIKLLAQDRGLREKLSRGARDYYYNNFSKEVSLRLHLEYLNSIKDDKNQK